MDYASGKPCKDIIEVPWHTSAMQTLKFALLAIRQMLSSPSAGACLPAWLCDSLSRSCQFVNADEAAVNTAAAAELREGVDVFDKHAASETQRFAKD